MKFNEQIQLWRNEYLASLKEWQETPNQVQLHFAEVIKKNWHGTKYLARNLPFAGDKIIICPPHSALNMASNQQHRVDYATGVFEGSSAEAVLDQNNKITAINVLLHKARIERFARSLKARGYDLHLPIARFAQSLLDIVAIHGADVVTNDDGSPTRAYVRPSAGPGVGAWGVSFKSDHFIEASNLTFRWGPYFPDAERVYYTSGAKVVITGSKRTFKISGKHASNYGSAAVDGNLARKMYYDELIFLAPYGLRNNELDYGITSFAELMRYGVLADGPGEELFGVLKDGSTLVYPPMRVNRLGGTVLDYVVRCLAPKLGIVTREEDITLQQIRDGEVIALAFAGNAAKIAPIGSIDLVQPGENHSGKKIETLATFGIHPLIASIRDQYTNEISGKKPPSDPLLLTPVDLVWGREFRFELDNFWRRFGLVE